jgi:hypothetical protein
VKRPNYWYDATVTVRVYLPGYPPDEEPSEDNSDDMSLELSTLLDGTTTSTGLLLSVHGIDWSGPYGYEEES